MSAFVGWMNGWLYQPYVVPLLLIGVGIYFTIRTGFVQIRLFPEMFKVVTEKPKDEKGVSSFGALMVSTASRVGTGNIIGVCTAIVTGGAGAIFWMWITAILGGANAFIESTLAQIYKRKSKEDGLYYGGPSNYMQNALGAKWLGVIFAVLIIFTYAIGYNMLAAFNLQSTFATFSFYKEGTTPAIIGIVLAIAFGYCVFGGGKKLIDITGKLVPLMGILYVAISLVVLVLNAKNFGAMFEMIFKSAFDFKAIFGGFTGSCIMWGLKRGLYSNEAGMGSAPNAAAKADVSHPVKQGLVQTLSVFIDTLLICTATAFMCLSTLDVDPSTFLVDGAADAAGYVQSCLASSLGSIGPVFIAVSMSLFAFTTLIGNYSYIEGCLAFILQRDITEKEAKISRALAIVFVFLGSIASAGLVWDTADMAQGLMVLCNIPTIAIIGGVACKALKDYTDQRKAGKDPEFKAANIGLENEKVNCWK